MPEMVRGSIWWIDLNPVRGREQAGRRPGLIVASNAYLLRADTLTITVPITSIDRNWPNHIVLTGSEVLLDKPSFAMTEQPRTISRSRVFGYLGQVDKETMSRVDLWLRDFLSLR